MCWGGLIEGVGGIIIVDNEIIVNYIRKWFLCITMLKLSKIYI